MEEIFSIIQFLKQAVKTGASDEHLMVGHAPYLRINGFNKRRYRQRNIRYCTYKHQRQNFNTA